MSVLTKIFKKNTTAGMWKQFEEASKRKPRSDDPDAPFLTETELAEMRPVRRRGRPPKANPKQDTHILFDADLLAHLRASGRGWQTRVGNYIRAGIKKGAL